MVQDPTSDPTAKASRPPRHLCAYASGVCFLCMALLLLATVLFFSIIFVVLDVPHGFQSVTLRSLIADVFIAVIVPVIVFAGDILKSLFPWPVLVILALALLAWGPDKVREIISSAKLELPGGIKFAGGAAPSDAFKKEMGDVQKNVARTNKEIEEAYAAAKTYVSQLRDKYELDKLVGDLSVQIARTIGPTCPDDYRLTVHVPDLVFSDRLYQLVEYYDSNGRRITEGKSGRAFSIRYGIIGRVWRSGVAEVEGELISPEDRAQLGENPSVREMEKFIARRWGLTLDEAVRIQPYPSYGAIRIERGDKPLGVVFFDSKRKNAFNGAKNSFKIQAAVQESDLALSLLEISREITSWSRIQIFRNP